MTDPLLADDLFAGAGGWDVAARELGITARGVENMDAARATRDAAGLSTVHDDVWTFTPDESASGLIASPPCQTFSKAGSGSGRKALDQVLALIPQVPDMTLRDLRLTGTALGDERTALVLTPLWFALHYPYRWLAWEQVPTVLPVWEACTNALRAVGWSVWTGVLHSERYGVPQTRTRAVLLGARDREVSEPVATHSRYHSRNPTKLDEGVLPWVSMAEALGWPTCEAVGFPRLADGQGEVVHLDGTDYRARDLRDTTDPAFAVTSKARSWQRVHPHGEACTCPVTLTATNDRPNVCHRTPCQPAPTMAFGHETPRWNPRDTTPDGYERWAQQSDNEPDYTWPDNRPATTVAGRDLVQAPGATANRFNGRTKSRNDGVRVSVGEAGVLQSFPANFPWAGTRTRQFLQVGNAIPPGMALPALRVASGLSSSVHVPTPREETMTITPITPQVDRDRYGRPLVVPPTGGKPVPYTRCTTFVGSVEDMFKLGQWQQRHAVRGVALNDDLVAAVRDTDPTDVSGLNTLVDEAKERSGAGDAARLGTYLHAVTEAADRGQDPGAVELPWLSTGPMDPLAYLPDLAAYREATADLKAVHIESFCVEDWLKVGGTPDRVVSYRGKRYIADLKTGSIKYGHAKIAAQLAVYARSYLYDPATGERTRHGADLERGIVIHLPAGSGTCTLHWIDLMEGWEVAKVARSVREKRSLPFSKLVTGIGTEATPDPVATPPAPTSLEDHIVAANGPEAVRALWKEHTSEWTDHHTELAKARIAALASSPTTK